MEPTLHQTIAGWLNDLTVLVAGRMPLAEARERIAAYTSLLADEFGRADFTRQSLARAAKTFKWFPSYGELYEMLTIPEGRARVEESPFDALDRLQAERAAQEKISHGH